MKTEQELVKEHQSIEMEINELKADIHFINAEVELLKQTELKQLGYKKQIETEIAIVKESEKP